jgi:hypothetical protein
VSSTSRWTRNGAKQESSSAPRIEPQRARFILMAPSKVTVTALTLTWPPDMPPRSPVLYSALAEPLTVQGTPT